MSFIDVSLTQILVSDRVEFSFTSAAQYTESVTNSSWEMNFISVEADLGLR